MQLLPLGREPWWDGKKVHGNLPSSEVFSCIQELLLDGFQLHPDMEDSRNAINSICQSFCLQIPSIVSLGQVPHRPL